MNTPLRMPVAAPVSYSASPSPTTPVVIALSLYLFAVLLSACILCYFHRRSNPPPYECHISRPLALTNLPTHPRPTLNRSGSPFSRPLDSTPYIPSSSPSRPSSLLLKDSQDTRLTSPANSSSNFYILSPSPKSNTSVPAQTTYLAILAFRFALLSPFLSDQSLNYSTPIPSTATWRSSLAKSFTQPFDKSTLPSPKLSNNTTVDRLESTPPLLPFPWPFESHHAPLHLLPPQ